MKRWPLREAYFWETAPFFRLLLPFAGGILFYDAGGFARHGSALLFIICFLFVLLAGVVFSRKNHSQFVFFAAGRDRFFLRNSGLGFC